jgi:hypothetical protein
MPDLRPLNDAKWSSDALRTQHCLPVALALWLWSDWSDARQQAFAERLAIATVREILADMLDACGLDSTACRAVTTLSEAESAARAARAAAAAAAADADAARAAYAARAAASARAADASARAADATLIKACAIWVRCAAETAEGGL